VSIRTIYLVTALWMALLVAVLSTALILTSNWLARDATRVNQATQGVLVAQQLEIQSMIFTRESLLDALTGEREHSHLRDQAREQLRKLLNTAHDQADSDEERTLVRQIDDEIQRLIVHMGRPPEGDGSQIDIYRENIAATGPAFRKLDALLALNLQQAATATSDVARWNQVADNIGVSLLIAVPLMLIGLVLAARRIIYLPSIRLRDSIVRFSGEPHLRAPLEGPAEFRDVARVFNDMADELGRQRERQLAFVAAIAHDLRNPLTALKTTSLLAARNAGRMDEEKLRQCFDLTRRQIDRLDGMVNDFLDSSLIHAGRLKLSLAPCDVRDVVNDVAQLFGASSSRHTLRVTLPQESLTAMCDRARIEQVLNNLVSNAIKYSPEGGAVELSAYEEECQIVIAVKDEGVGMSTADIRELFQPFRRVGSAKEFIPGIGLGLSVVKKLVEAHHGTTEVDSQLGCGSVFRIRLPAA
jgi:two-component system, OmpR family, sensor histidine kinase MtrB